MEQNKILDGKLTITILSFFFPIWLGTFFQQLYNTVDAVIVGNFVNKQALAAVGGPTGTVINLLVGFFVGLSSGAGVVVAQYFGAKNAEKTRLAINTALAIAICGGLILICVGVPLSPYLLKAMDTPKDIMDFAVTYIRIYFCGSVFNLVYNIGSGIMRAMGNSKKPLQFLIIASITNIILDIVFVVFMGLGVAGVGIATVLSQFISCCLVILSLMNSQNENALVIKDIKIDKATCMEIFKIGIPTGLQSIMFSLSNLIIQSSINSFGTDTVAAYTAYGKLDAIFWMTLNSFGITCTTFVGQNFGAKKYDRVKKCMLTSTVLATVTTVILSVGLYFGCTVFYRIFTSDANVIEIGVHIVRYLVPYYISYVAIEILSGTMRGVGDSLIPTLITVFGICVLRVGWIWFAVPLNHTLNMTLTSYPLPWCATAVGFICYNFFGGWFKRAIARKNKI